MTTTHSREEGYCCAGLRGEASDLVDILDVEISDKVVRLYLNNNHHSGSAIWTEMTSNGIGSIWRDGHCQELPWSSSGVDRQLELPSI
eukprot:scaffold421294_cov56-Attheya_sp.AAC.1